MEIQIEVPNKKASENFANWFRKEGFELFTKSKFNKLDAKNTDCYITCLATDEKLTSFNEYAGVYFDIQ